MRKFLLGRSFAMMLPAPAAAQSTLLEQGEQLLEGLGGSSGGALSIDEMAAGLKEALSEGVKRVVGQVGRDDGYNADPEIHIPLPESLETVQKSLRAVGMSGLADDVELQLNRGAERAAPEAVDVFANAITAMTWDDAERILNGRKDEATRYFRRTMTPDLTERFTPIVEESLAEVGAIRSYDEMMGQYDSLPFPW